MIQGGDPNGDPSRWEGFIGDEPLLVQPPFFAALSAANLAFGFVSGAEPPSCRYVLESRLGLKDPPLIAMGDAPDKPDPTGLLRLAAHLAGGALGTSAPPVAYLGDTVADVLTVQRARAQCPDQRFLSLAVAPPHLHGQPEARATYEAKLLEVGADVVLEIDFQGSVQVKKLFANAVSIFILPPSWEELKSRLHNRGEDAPDVIDLRLQNAADEMAKANEFDFVIINELFERAVFDLKAVVHAQRLKYSAQRRARADVFDALNLN